MNVEVHEGNLILFQGDSITDAGRNREDPASLGSGYAMMIAAQLQAHQPEMRLRFLNRGIGGNRVADLLKRWKDDTTDLKPDILSILIGINDCWRRYDSNDPTSLEKFESGYRELLMKTTERLPNIQLVLCEPFLLHVNPGQDRWREDLDPKIQAVRRLALEFGAVLVPFDGMFAQAATRREPAFWAEDGVHPSTAAHALMADAWLDAFWG